jgi:hypothetical protein
MVETAQLSREKSPDLSFIPEQLQMAYRKILIMNPANEDLL